MPSETRVVLRFVKLTEKALAPVKGSAKAAGFDLRSAYDVTVPARGKELIKTDLQIELPSGCYGRIAPRSGLALKHHIDVGGKLNLVFRLKSKNRIHAEQLNLRNVARQPDFGYLFSLAGVVDEDYRGNLGVVLFNHSDQPFNISHGDRIAQLICQKIYYPELQEVEELDETERGKNGFGSTGSK